ncbi:MAG TPA: Rv3654c family TadE-like protein [Natronosporangium sp.]|nr:Rv3654c family TadE-like protein [Natronosporangium sp.]
MSGRRSGSERGCWPAGSDRGAASVWLLAAGLVLVAAGMVGATLGAAQVARHRAQSAADLGALAGAARALAGPAAACARAAEFIAHNDGRLTACTLDGLDLTVTASIPAAPAVLPGVAATATARAGPVRADDASGAR